MSLKPDKARFFSISHPRPPAPLPQSQLLPAPTLDVDIYKHDPNTRQKAETIDSPEITDITLAVLRTEGVQSGSVKGPGVWRMLFRYFLPQVS